ncbi:MAG: VWA domain-containing protein [Pirellulales bacterium]|nr:VWA domain-containing protein [Pirellulales bacterium]
MARKARQTRPQLVCVLADNSGSMAGPKAKAATEGIREMLLRCQTTGPRGPERSYFRFVLIPFGTTATLQCNMLPVRQIDADTIEVRGDGGGTNITEALELAYGGLERYMREVVEPHPEKTEHPLPLVLLFSDGHNGFGQPEPIARKIKDLSVDGESVMVACAGVSTDSSDQPDETLLRAIASPDCYVHIDNVRMLSAFLAEVGSSGASSPREVAQIIHRLENMRGVQD